MAAPNLQVGIIGTGWGVSVQLPAFRNCGCDVTAIYSRSIERAKKIAEENNVKLAFDDSNELATNHDVQIVSVVVPTHERFKHVMNVLKAGKHVLADKPFAMNKAEAKTMMEEAKRLKNTMSLRAYLDFETRLVPGIQRMRSVIRNKYLGNVRTITFRAMVNFDFASKDSAFCHWSQRECGGGSFSAIGTHLVDTARFILDDEIHRLMAIEDPIVSSQKDPNSGLDRDVTSGFYVSCHMITKKGTHISMLINSVAPGLESDNTVIVTCDEGSMTFDYMSSTYNLHSAKSESQSGGPDEIITNKGNAFSEVGTNLLVKAIRSAIVFGDLETNQELFTLREDIATFYDGYQVQKVTDAVHLSSAEGGAWHTIEDD